MHGFVYYLRSLDGFDLEAQRHACHRLAGDDAVVLAEFIEHGRDNREKLLQALELSSQKNATFVGAPGLPQMIQGREAT